MISRVAESCFWLFRYLERADATARVLGVNVGYELDTRLGRPEFWRPVLVVSGEAPAFDATHGAGSAEDGEVVQHHLTWESENPASIHSSIFWARENARTVREAISREMWECLNGLWLWLESPAARRTYERERSEFYAELKRAIQMFRGTTSDTMLHEEPLEFMRLGLNLERAGMTARILDVSYHLLETAEETGSPTVGSASRHAILRSCGGIEAFFKRGRAPTRGAIAAFLLKDAAFPRSVDHCVARVDHALGRIVAVEADETSEAPPRVSLALAADLRERVASLNPREWSPVALHEALTGIVESCAALSDAVGDDFFLAEAPAVEVHEVEA